MLLDCGKKKKRSQEKTTMKKSLLQYPKSAASLSDYPNHSTWTSKCSTNICNLHKEQFHSATGQSERWVGHKAKAKATYSPPFSQMFTPLKGKILKAWMTMHSRAQYLKHWQWVFNTPLWWLCPSHPNALQFKPSVLRSRGPESWVQRRDCLWIFYSTWQEPTVECSGTEERLAKIVWDSAFLLYKQILFM